MKNPNAPHIIQKISQKQENTVLDENTKIRVYK